MKSRRDGNILVIRLDDGEDMFQSLEDAVQLNRISSGIVLTGIGMLRDFEIGYYNGENYVKKRVKTPHELIALHGSISSSPDDMRFHIHAALADPEHRITGGHLFGGKVNVVNEISVLVLENVGLVRRKEERTGLALLDFLD